MTLNELKARIDALVLLGKGDFPVVIDHPSRGAQKIDTGVTVVDGQEGFTNYVVIA